jgi:putative phosphoribosyl transferase
MSTPFRDRRDAGRQLASALKELRLTSPCVLAVPTGGVPVAYEIARALYAPLDVFVMCNVPAQARHAAPLGVIGSGGARLLNRDLIYGMHIPPRMIDELMRVARATLLIEESEYRDDAPPLRVQGRDVILVGDGTPGLDQLRQSIQLLRELEAEHVIVAVPTMARGQANALSHIADDVVTVRTSEVHEPLRWYDDFTPTTAGEVRALLALAQAERQLSVA